MFDFIKQEHHSFLKKILGIGTLLGVLSEAIKQSTEQKAGGAGFFAFCSLFVFIWLIDVFKDGGSEVIEAADKAETAAFSSTKAFSVDLPAPPSADLVKKVRKQVKQLLNERFPAGRGAEINDYADQGYLFRAEVYRNTLCACEVSARLKTYGRLVTSSGELKLTEEPRPYIGSLDVAIERKSELRNFLTISAVVLFAISGVLGLAGSDDGAGGAKLLSGIVMVVAVPVCISAWTRMSRWFPATLLAALSSDVLAILVENDFLKPGPGTQVRTGPHPAFWNVEVPHRHGMKFWLGSTLSVAVGVASLWWAVKPDNTIEGGLEALHTGNYGKAERILFPLAKSGNIKAREELEKFADQMNGLEQWYVLGTLAEMGYVPAQFNMAYYNRFGTADGAALMKEASDQGLADAQAVMADWYLEGRGVAANPQEANRLYGLAAAQGNHYAQFRLYDFALKRKHYREAYYWLEICAEEGPHPSKIIVNNCPQDSGELEKRLSTKQRDAAEHDVWEFLEANHLGKK